MSKQPADRTPYPQDPRSRTAGPWMTDGTYVYVRDLQGVVYALPDGPHLHPRVLGNAQPAMYAGDLTIESGQVIDITNLSGTFEFDDRAELLEVLKQLEIQGLVVATGSARFFACDGMSPPVTLN